MPATDQPIIALQDVTVSVKGKTILQGVSLEVSRGECLTLVGRSGAGKSTCLRLVNGLVRASSGKVLVDGMELDSHDLVALRRRVGYVIQAVGLLPHLDVARNVGLVPELLGWAASKISARADEVLSLVGLPPAEFRHRKPRELSGGEQQRVGVARALAAEPAIVLMDEPFGAVDPLLRVELQRDVDALRRKLGTTVLLVTHDVREAIVMSDRIALVDDGRIAFVGTPKALFESDNPAARAYAGSLRAGDDAIARRLEAP